jgi:hypothetical protein
MWPTASLSLQKKSNSGFVSPLKFHRPQPGLYPRTLGRMASMITTRTSRTTTYEVTLRAFVWRDRGKTTEISARLGSNAAKIQTGAPWIQVTATPAWLVLSKVIRQPSPIENVVLQLSIQFKYQLWSFIRRQLLSSPPWGSVIPVSVLSRKIHSCVQTAEVTCALKLWGFEVNMCIPPHPLTFRSFFHSRKKSSHWMEVLLDTNAEEANPTNVNRHRTHTVTLQNHAAPFSL